jgi:hypothetical protein
LATFARSFSYNAPRSFAQDSWAVYFPYKAFEAGLEFECEAQCPKSATGVVCGYAYNAQWFGGRGAIHICFDKTGCDFATTAANNQVAFDP